MARRCKLISPTNLMLEHPILSPVDECEYVLHGVKEFKKVTRDYFQAGLCAGGAVTALALLLAYLIRIAITGK